MTGQMRLLINAFLTTTTLGWCADSAFAQSAPIGIADVDVIVDENGVDLLTGKFYASVARAGSQDLVYEASWVGAYDASLLNTRVIVSGSDVFVSIRGKTTKFTKVGSDYIPDDADGATLVRFPSNNGFIYRNKAGDEAYFDDDAANLAGNAPGTTSARLSTLTFAEPTRESSNVVYETVSSGGLVYQRVSMIVGSSAFGSGQGYDALEFSYASNVATDANFKKLVSAKASYQGAYGTQTVVREQLTISSSMAAGVETVSMTDKGGAVTTITKGTNGITAIRNPGDAADGIAVSYNGQGEVSTFSSYGRAFTYAFGASGTNRTATVSLTGGGSKYYVVDPSRRILLSRRNEEMETESFSYDGEDRVTQITRPEGNYVALAYDARGNVTQATRIAKPGSGDSMTSTAFGYPAGCTNATPTCNEAIWSQDAKGVQTDYINGRTENEFYIDEIRFPAASVGGDRLMVLNKYSNVYGRIRDGSGFEEPSGVVSTELTQRVLLRAPLGNFSAPAGLSETYYSFDDNFGEHEILPLNSVDMGQNEGGGTLYRYSAVSNSFDSFGRLETEQSIGFGYGSRYRYYDARNRLIGFIESDYDGAGPMLFGATRITYNSRGLVERIETGTVTSQTQAALNTMTVLRATERSYDANRRLEKSLVRAGGEVIALTQYSYNPQGLVECAAVRMNPATFAALPASACTPGTPGSFGPDRISRNHYDLAGRLLRTEAALGTAEVKDEVAYTYNDNGSIATVADGRGNRTSYEYDGHDRLKKTIFPHRTSIGTSDPSDFEQYWYDANDNVIQKRLRDGQSIYFTYDRLDRLTLVDLPNAESDVSYTYDVEGRLKTATRGTVSNAISYDPFGRMISEGGSLGAVQFQYDELNRPTRMTWPDGFFVTYEYNEIGPIKAIKEYGSTPISTYGYDSFGRQVSITYGNGAVQTFGYDTRALLTSLAYDLSGTSSDHTISLTYNPALQIATRTGSNDGYAWTGHVNVDRPYAANGLNQYTSAGAAALGYDARGNLTSSGADTFGYSSDNLLTSGSGGATLTYNGRGQLFETAKAGATTRLLYAGSMLVGEYSGGNALLRRFVHGLGVDNPLLWYEGSGTTDKRFLMADERGSITAHTSGGADLFAINRYDEYGIPAAGNVGRFGYTGQTWLPEIGMNYYKARMYSPTLGRFMQTDPIGYGDGPNVYDYVGGDPINRIDPTGMVEETIGNPIIVTGKRINCFAFGGECSTGRDLADEFAYDYFQRRQAQAAPPAGKPGHYYRYTARVCTAAPNRPCHINRTNREICVLPGHISTSPIVSGDWYAVYSNIGDILPQGFVTTAETGQHSYRNTTTLLHPLSGTIDRIFSQDSRGNINVTTIGQGTAATTLQDSVNQELGPGIFRQQDKLCSAILGGK